MERMLKNMASLNQLHSTCPDGCSERYFDTDDSQEVDIFTTNQPDHRQLLAPTFLVPAVIEALKDSEQFSSLVQVVPGEADAFCARHLEEHGGVVLTSDSDLLVHDLGESGTVVFFRDIHMASVQSPVSCVMFDPVAISHRFGLGAHRLLRFAYELSRNPHSTVNAVVRQSFENNLVVEDWNAFCNQYLHVETIPIPSTAPNKDRLPLANLDPRLSELALQLGNNYKGDDYPRTFLPVPIDSPIRGTAWEQSTWIRQLAYSLLKRAVRAKSSCVIEYRRVSSIQQKGKQVAMLSEGHMKSAAVDIALWMSYIKGDIESSDVSPWLILALKFLVSGRPGEEEKTFHAQKVIEQALTRPLENTTRKISWDVIHLTAQVQAFYGSLRILNQILSILPKASWYSLLPEDTIPEELFTELAIFPSLHAFPSVHTIRSFLSRLHDPPITEILRHFIDVEQVLADAETTKQNTKKKRKKSAGSQGESTPKRPTKEAKLNGLGGNKFDLLPDADE